MMTVDQIVSAQKAQVASLFTLGNKTLESAEKFVELNLQASKAALAETAAHTGDQHHLVLRDHQAIGAAELAVHKVAVVVDVVVAGEKHRVHALAGHHAAQLGNAGGVFLVAEAVADFLAVVDVDEVWHGHGKTPASRPS